MQALCAGRSIHAPPSPLGKWTSRQHALPHTHTYPLGRLAQFSLLKVEADRDVSGSCGVPGSYSQTRNEGLGYLCISDVMASFYQVRAAAATAAARAAAAT